MPELPTVAESGVKGYEGATWYGVVAPARTPPAIVTLLNRDIVRALHEPDVKERLTAQGVEIVGSTPPAFAQFIRSEIPKWAKAVQLSGARVD
jgi:tripartite-type tricarboxylate transporter receptor subunit TctC